MTLALQAGFRLPEGGFGLLAPDGVANSAPRLPAIGLAFDEVIPNAVPNGFQAHRFIRNPGQHHDAQVRRRRARPDKSVAAGAVRKGQV